MPTEYDRNAFEEAIENKNQDQIRAFLQRDDGNELMLMKNDSGYLPTHDACLFGLDTTCLQLILNAGVQHGIAKQMLEEKTDKGWTCLHLACWKDLCTDSLRLLFEYLSQYTDIKKVLEEKTNNGSTCLHVACAGDLSPDSFRLLLEYLTKHADIKKMLEEKNNRGTTCLHLACANDLSPDSLRLLLEYLANHSHIEKELEEKTDDAQTCLHNASRNKLSTDSLRFLISFFPSKNLLASALDARNKKKETPIDCAKNVEAKQLLRDPECFEKCRLWLLRNHEDTFLYARYLNSLEKTCQALKELPKSALQHSQQHATIMLIAFMSSPSKFREAVDKTDSSAPMASYFDVVKKGDQKSDYNHWRKNIRLFREFYGQWPPSERKTASDYEKDASGSSCSIQ